MRNTCTVRPLRILTSFDEFLWIICAYSSQLQQRRKKTLQIRYRFQFESSWRYERSSVHFLIRSLRSYVRDVADFARWFFSENKCTYFDLFMIWNRWNVFCCWFLLWFLQSVYLVVTRFPPRQYFSMSYRGFSLPAFCRHSVSRSLQGRAFLSCIRDHDVEVLDVTRKFFTKIWLRMIVERFSTFT